jgi:flagellar biogenesis protein FliO
MAPGFESADLFRMIGSFILVLAIMAGLLWALRKLQSRLNSQNSGKRMQVLETSPLPK